ncbi:MAG TPA: hypothetical protein VFH27_00690 [Longimicrobiaceae bacterium]|nr:hypothetical protein [Longimicrobiaceae bacterium]
MDAPAAPTPRTSAPEPTSPPPRAGEDELGRVLRLVVLTLVVAWAAAAVVRTGTRLAADDEGWRIARGTGAEGVTGAPLRGAGRVTAVRTLLHRVARGRERWLVVLPPGVAPVEQEYLRGQLMVLEYPRLVTVTSLDRPLQTSGFEGVVLPAAAQVRGRAPAASAGGYAAYRVPRA